MDRRTITLIGEKIVIDVDESDYYPTMLNAIIARVFELLGPEFDKRAFLAEVEKGRLAAKVGQELAIPVSIMLAMELGYCLGQLKSLGRILDCDKVLKDLYNLWKARLKQMLQEEMISSGLVH